MYCSALVNITSHSMLESGLRDLSLLWSPTGTRLQPSLVMWVTIFSEGHWYTWPVLMCRIFSRFLDISSSNKQCLLITFNFTSL